MRRSRMDIVIITRNQKPITVNVFNQTQSGIKCKPFIPPLAENRLPSICLEKYNKIPIGNDDGYFYTEHDRIPFTAIPLNSCVSEPRGVNRHFYAIDSS